jgi:hypothetical protein
MTLDPWQARIGGLILGAGPYTITGPITGLGGLEPRTTDRDLETFAGSAAGRDTLPARTLRIPVSVGGYDPAETLRHLRALRTAFAPRDDLVEFEVRLPGLTGDPSDTLTFYGRPRGTDEDLDRLKSAEAGALCRFDALDPFGYGPPITVTRGPGTHELLNPGDVPTRRVLVEIVGNNGTPALTNSTDDGRFVAWANPLGGNVVRVVDLAARTVADTLDGDRYAELASASTWFGLRPGLNTVTVGGAQTATFTIRPAYL